MHRIIAVPGAVLTVLYALTLPAAPPPKQPSAQTSLAKLPLYFEPNQGQASPEVQFIGRTGGGLFFLTDRGFTIRLAPTTKDSSAAALRMQFIGAKGGSATPEALLPGVSNYLRGNRSEQWHTRIPHFSRVRYKDIYPGVDLLYYGDPKRMEYDLILKPGADPNQIEMAWEGVISQRINADGDLVMLTGAGELLLHRPRVYQEADGRREADGRQQAAQRREIAARYRIHRNRVHFALASYDRRRPLTIDPVLAYATYYGGAADDRALGIAVDQFGSAYITGQTASADLPTVPGSLDRSFNGNIDAFIAKISPGGDSLMYATFLGGTGRDYGNGIVVDGNLNAYVTGSTESLDFPLANAIKKQFQGAVEAFVVELDSTGSFLLFSTFIGGRNEDYGLGIALDSAGAIYATGNTTSIDFPTTAGAIQPQVPPPPDTLQHNHGFVVKLSQDAQTFVWQTVYSTYLGGTAQDFPLAIAADASGNAYVVGQTVSTDFPVTSDALKTTNSGGGDIFLTKINLSGTKMLYSTFLGGTDNDLPQAIAVDQFGRAYITGVTESTNFPVTPGAIQPSIASFDDVFVTAFNSLGKELLLSTYLGGNAYEIGKGIGVGPLGHVYVTGGTASGNFPIVTNPSPVQQFNGGGTADAFLTVYSPTLKSLAFSSYLGGGGYEVANAIAVDINSDPYIAGEVQASNFPVTPGSYDTSPKGLMDAFVAKITNFRYLPCRGQVSTPLQTFPKEGGASIMTVTADLACTWWASSSTSAFPITGSATATGNGMITFNVSSNGQTLPRAGAVNIAGNLIQIIQNGTATSPPYSDVPLDHPMVDHIALLKANAITTGCSSTAYCPDASTTRGQMAVFIIRSLVGTESFPFPSTPYFTDVPSAHPYFKYIQKMRQLGITAGCSPTQYCPDNVVTRGQMSVFLMRARMGENFTFAQTPYFADVPVNHPYFKYIQKMKELGITVGCSASTYCPESQTLRSQMAVFIIRTFFAPW